MSTVNLTEEIREFPQLLQSEYFNSLEESLLSQKTPHTTRFS